MTAQLTMHHVGVAVSSIGQALPSYREIFGYELLSGPFSDPIQRVKVCFVGKKEAQPPMIELVEPEGDHSPVNRYLAKGIGAYHVCYATPDIELALTHVRAKGCMVVSQPVPAVAFNGRRIAWFLTPTHQLIELLEQ